MSQSSIGWGERTVPLYSQFSEVKDRQHIIFILGIIALVIVLVVMITTLWLVTLRGNLHPLRQRSPKLMIISTSGNFLFALALLVQGLFFSGCLMQADDQDITCPAGLCSEAWVAKMNCMLGFLSISVFEPMAIIPYFARTVRIYTIFKAQEFYFRYKRKPESWFKWIMEPRMLKVSAFLLGFLLIISIIIFVIVVIYDDEQKMHLLQYIPSYTTYMCFMTNICGEPSVITVENHVNSTLIWLIVLNFLGNIFFLTCIYKLRNIKSEFNIRLELFCTFLVWFFITQLTIGLFINQGDMSPNFDWLHLILVVRSVAAVLLTGVKPLYQIYTGKGNQFILLPPNQECIESLDMVLQIPIAIKYFYWYLEQYSVIDDPQITYFFSLYVDLRQFDKAVSQKVDEETLKKKALDIQEEYLDEEGPYRVQVRADVLQATKQKIEALTSAEQGDVTMHNKLIFIELLSYVLDKLKVHFERFKRSPLFVDLEEEISRQEKHYEILVDASIITN